MRFYSLKKTCTAMVCAVSLVIALADVSSKDVSAAVIRQTDTTVASSGNVLIGVDGTFLSSDLQAGVKRINEIRKEAYEEHIVDAYVPVRLSAELNEIAKIRAAEAALAMGHTRPNGTKCITASYQQMKSYGEILAWNFSGLVDGINQWYEEKEDLLNNTGGETGHYEQMIDPNNQYMGLSCFRSASGVAFPCSICGEFNMYSSAHTDVTEEKEDSYDVTQIIEVPAEKVTVSGQQTLNGKAGTDELFGFPVKYNSRVSAKVYDLSWTSSDEEIAVVRDNRIHFLKSGNATLTTTVLNQEYQITVQVIGDENAPTDNPSETETPASSIVPTGTETPDTPETIVTPTPGKTTTSTPKPAKTATTVSKANPCKKVKAAKKTYVISKKGKTAKIVFQITSGSSSKVTTDSVSVSFSKKAIVKVQKKALGKKKLTITVKGLKKGKTALTVTIGKKKAKTVVKVKK